MRPRDTSPMAGIDMADLLTAEEMAEIGADLPDSLGADAVEVWPDSVDALRLYSETVTQWRWSPGGPAGIEDSAVDRAIRRCGIRGSHRRRAIDRLKVMESETLRIVSERAAAAARQ